MNETDAVVVGAGPNGLAAAITLAERGLAVQVFEAADTPGGGCRTEELTLPGFQHDVCSTVQALATVSPFFRTIDLAALGVQLCRPDIAYAHPLDGGRAALLHPDLATTAAGLGVDGAAWTGLFQPLVEHADQLWPDVLGSLRRIPRHPLSLARFGLPALRSASGLAHSRFETDEARALLIGAAAHSMRRLDAPVTSAFGLVLALSAHAVNWPVVKGGSGVLTDALVERLHQLGGRVECGRRIDSFAELPPARVTMLDVSPRSLLSIAGDKLSGRYAAALKRFRYGPGVFKIDYALSGPVPWTAPGCDRAGTLHLGGTAEEIAAGEGAVESGRHPDAPYVLVVQASVMDPTRAPDGQHTLWAYCHVPNGSTVDMTAAIERQIERFAPGFGDLVLARATRNAQQYEAYDANYVGGDINAGLASLYGVALGPVPQWSRYATPLDGVYLCSSATPPGGGVHGMAGCSAALEALRKHF